MLKHDSDANLSTSQAYVPPIHRFAPETQEKDVVLRGKKTEKSHANMIWSISISISILPSVTYSICVVWWWNLWLSAFLQWKRALKTHITHTALSLRALCDWIKETVLIRAWCKQQITDPPAPHFILTLTWHSLFITGWLAINSTLEKKKPSTTKPLAAGLALWLTKQVYFLVCCDFFFLISSLSVQRTHGV